MKIPFLNKELRFSDTTGPPPTQRSGPGGNVDISPGLITGLDYNSDWENISTRFDLIEEMRRSDGHCARTEALITGPFLSADWSFDAASDSANDTFIREYLAYNFFQRMRWKQNILPDVLLALAFGYMVFQIVFDDELTEFTAEEGTWNGSKTRLVRHFNLYPRMPQSIENRFDLDPSSGAIKGVEQYVGGEMIKIPIDELVVICPRREGDDWTGRSIFRSAYKHWFYKKNIELVVAMGIERFYLPIPVFKPELPGARDPEVEAECAEMAKKLRAHEQMYLWLPDVGVEFPSPGSSLPDVMPIIDYHNREIAAGMLQEAMELGQSKRGARAVGEVQISPFYLMVQAIADQVIEAFQLFCIPKAVGFNFPNIDRYPQLKCTRIAPADVAAVADAVQKLEASKFLTPNAQDEAHIRKLLKFPVKSLQEIEKAQEEAKRLEEKTKQPAKQPGIRNVANPLAASELSDRELSEPEMHVNFSGMENFLDTAKEDLKAALRPVRKRQSKDLAKKAGVVLADGKLDPDRLKLSDKAEFSRIVRQHLLAAFEFGEKQVNSEISSQRRGQDLVERKVNARSVGELEFAEKKNDRRKEKLLAVMWARSKALSESSANQYRQHTMNRVTSFMSQDIEDYDDIEELLEEELDGLSEGALGALGILGITEAMNLGRQYGAFQFADELSRVTLSAVMDHSTCASCMTVDGEEVPLSTALDTPPAAFTDCAGAEKCRCIWVWEL